MPLEDDVERAIVAAIQQHVKGDPAPLSAERFSKRYGRPATSRPVLPEQPVHSDRECAQ